MCCCDSCNNNHQVEVRAAAAVAKRETTFAINMTTKKSSNDCKCKNTKGVLKAKAVGRKKKDKASEGCAAQRVKPVTGNKRKTLEAVFIIGLRGQHGVASSKEVGRLVKTATAKSLDTTISAIVHL